ncbi:MAG: SDR family NAD(P)-dependent oxidoreductase [Fibrobacterota bacterium]
MKKAFITGVSSGLGAGFARTLTENNWQVYGCSRRETAPEKVIHRPMDLTRFETLSAELNALLGGTEHLDLMILNAGTLGDIKDMHDTSIAELRGIFEINVWAQKAVLDWCIDADVSVDQIILISSGASVLGNRGWSGYALSKAAVNMIARLYAQEMEESHLTALAPGLIETAMTRYLMHEVDQGKFTAVRRIAEAKENGVMLSPSDAARRVIATLEKLRTYESGSFLDIRQIVSPEEYDALMQARSGPTQS